MTGLVRKATLLSVCGLLAAGAALANVPSATNSSEGGIIRLVGRNGAGTVVDPVGNYTVVVRDLANNPIQNSSVVLDFSVCGSFDTRLANSQIHPGVTLDCPTKSVRGLTDATGTIVFRVMGGAQNTGAAPGNLSPCARVFADGVLIKDAVTTGGTGNVKVAAYDENGVGGVTPLDLSAWVGDFFAAGAPYLVRSDFDGNGALSPLDLSNQVAVFFAAGSFTGAAGYCP
jgi:hypothetical protein